MQHNSLPVPVQFVTIYVSPNCTYQYLIQKFEEIMTDVDTTYPITVLGDFNMKSVMKLEHGYNTPIEKYMESTFSLTQIIQKNTTDYQSVLDLCFTNTHIDYSLIWNHWSDHKIVAVALYFKCGTYYWILILKKYNILT